MCTMNRDLDHHGAEGDAAGRRSARTDANQPAGTGADGLCHHGRFK
jgi:hypothetical protein